MNKELAVLNDIRKTLIDKTWYLYHNFEDFRAKHPFYDNEDCENYVDNFYQLKLLKNVLEAMENISSLGLSKTHLELIRYLSYEEYVEQFEAYQKYHSDILKYEVKRNSDEFRLLKEVFGE